MKRGENVEIVPSAQTLHLKAHSAGVRSKVGDGDWSTHSHYGVCSRSEKDGYFGMWVLTVEGEVVEQDVQSNQCVAEAWAGWFPEPDEDVINDWLWEHGPDWWREMNSCDGG